MRSSQHRRRSLRRRSRRTAKSLALVFALLFAPVAAPSARAECVPCVLQSQIGSLTSVASEAHAHDLDGDGDVDLLVGAFTRGVLWLENRPPGDGSSWSQHTISTFVENVQEVSAADVDGDGDLDAVYTEVADTLLAWYENIGSAGAWPQHVIATGSTALGAGVIANAAADLDLDGDVDVLFASEGDRWIGWFRNLDGEGAAWSRQTVFADTETDGLWDLVVGDVDGDGDPDALSWSFATGLFAWHENVSRGGDDPWPLHTIAVVSTAIAPAELAPYDLDADGDLDLAAAVSVEDALVWFENVDESTPGTGRGAEWSTHSIATALDGISATAVSDLDGDGDHDLIATINDPGITALDRAVWFENLAPGDGLSWRLHTLGNGLDGLYSPTAALAADLDGDGDPDPIVGISTYGPLTWFRNLRPHGTALFGSPQTVATGLDWNLTVQPGDLDGDGDVDLVSLSQDNSLLAWYANDGAGAGWAFHSVADAPQVAFATPHDVDQDGDLDLVSAAGGNRTAWHENVDLTDPGTGNGTLWSLHTVSTGSASISKVVPADVDGDGDPDVVTAGAAPGNSSIVWYRNDDPFSLAHWATVPVATAVDQVVAIAANDFDQDGDLDILGSMSGDPERISWWRNTDPEGNGTTWSEFTIVATPDPANLATGDLDRDGDDDVAFASGGGAGGVFWAANPRGTGAWTTQTVATASPLLWSDDVAISDFDRDGDLDILATSSYAPRVAWYENLDGDGASWTTHLLSTVDAVRFGTAADLDGDGDDDAVVASRNSGRVDWFENRSSHVFTNGLDSESSSGANLACWSSNLP